MRRQWSTSVRTIACGSKPSGSVVIGSISACTPAASRTGTAPGRRSGDGISSSAGSAGLEKAWWARTRQRVTCEARSVSGGTTRSARSAAA